MKKLIKITAVILIVAIAAVCVVMPYFSVSAVEGKLNYLLLGDSIAFGAGIVNPDEACFTTTNCCAIVAW